MLTLQSSAKPMTREQAHVAALRDLAAKQHKAGRHGTCRIVGSHR